MTNINEGEQAARAAQDFLLQPERRIPFPVMMRGQSGATLVAALHSIQSAKDAVDSASYEFLGSLHRGPEQNPLDMLIDKLDAIVPNNGEVVMAVPEGVVFPLTLDEVNLIDDEIIGMYKAHYEMVSNMPRGMRRFFRRDNITQFARILALDELNREFTSISGLAPAKKSTEFIEEKMKRLQKRK